PGPRVSASPAIARWKAWLCRLGIAGSTKRWRSSPARGAAFVSTLSIFPSESTRRTSRASPSGRSAFSAWITVMNTLPAAADRPRIRLFGLRRFRLSIYITARQRRGNAPRESVSGRSSMAKDDRIWSNARLATLDPARPGLGIVEDGAVAARDGRILFAGPAADLPPDVLSGAETVDCDGRWITPGLIDCHTHLVHAGNRAREFEMRLAGATYEEIARAGGGIVSSV